MQILYPYNEILPKRAAHDPFIFDECAALARCGCKVTLLCGKGSLSDSELFSHYGTKPQVFTVKRLPIIRKNNPLHLTWNRFFFFFSQQEIRRQKPDWVILSVRKQGAYHLSRKIPNVRYLYEIHELAHYPHHTSPHFHVEREMLNRADLITVTTEALKQILVEPPYSLSTPIEVVPLAVKKEPLPPPPTNDSPLVLMYIGQLYRGQGVERLIEAISLVEGVELKIVGGRPDEIAQLKKIAPKTVDFMGFMPPAALSGIAKVAHAFVAPFEASGRMPYVAHTKLFEYAHWGRPIIAPDLPTVREHFNSGTLLFEPENTKSLADCIYQLKNRDLRTHLQDEISSYKGKFSWEVRAGNYHELLSTTKH